MLLLIAAFLFPYPTYGYIGPGAGFALVTSLFTLVFSSLLAIFTLLILPFRMLVHTLKYRNRFRNGLTRRAVVIGFDGMDPDICEPLMDQGKMPHFDRLRKMGTYRRLGTTYPSLSPVAWSTFATGVGPGRHCIFDFLHRNPNTYMPELSSSRLEVPKQVLDIGKYRIPLRKPKFQFLRKSRSFWSLLSEQGIFSHILRVPLTFPPEKVNGVLLSAMCAPDLRGTQGSFTYYSSKKSEDEDYTGGIFSLLESVKDGYKGQIKGPDHPFLREKTTLSVSFRLVANESSSHAVLSLQDQSYELSLNTLSPWIRVKFRVGWGIHIQGAFQCCLKSIRPQASLYVSPIHIDPVKPALPISYPSYYAGYLARLFGRPFATLGLSEDTWALNEGILDEGVFWKQVFDIHQDRENHLFHSIRKMGKGLCVYVFDATDRIQHMFFRHRVPDHPANRDQAPSPYENAIDRVYMKADETLGKVMEMISEDTLLIVLSDHGFKPFIRGVNLNTWLYQNGYLALKDPDQSLDYLQNVDWDKTKAYAIGLAGIYLNIEGREKQGIVKRGEEENTIKQNIIRELSGLRDTERGESAIRRIYDTAAIYNGPYASDAPDLLVGYNVGYRISWDGAVGKVTPSVIEDNRKFWSGDHGIDPELVPGVLFSNYHVTEENPRITDIAPTLLNVFGIRPPQYMEGKALSIDKA